MPCYNIVFLCHVTSVIILFSNVMRFMCYNTMFRCHVTNMLKYYVQMSCD